MKKTHVSIGLIFAAMLLTACGGKSNGSKANTSVPERGQFTFNLELTDIYEGVNELKAEQNLRKQLSKGVSEFGGSQSTVYYNDGVAFQSVDYGYNYVCYSNDVAVTTMEGTMRYTIGDSAFAQKMSGTSNIAVVDGYLISSTDTYYSGTNYNNKNKEQVEFDDICETAEIYDLIESDGFYGIDSEGRGIYYYIDFYDSSTSGYDKYGNSITVYDYEVEEQLVIFDGDPLTGKPIAVYGNDTSYKNYDSNDVISEEYILKNTTSYEYEIKYGKRASFKNKDKLIKSIEASTFAQNPKIKFRSAPCTLTDNKDDIYSVDGSEYYPFSLLSAFDPATDYGSTISGVTYGKNLSFTKGSYYALSVDANSSRLVKDSNGDYSISGGSYSFESEKLAFDVEDNLPEGLKYIKNSNGFCFLYAEDDITVPYLSLTFSASISFDEEANDPVCEVKGTLSFEAF